MSTERPPDVQIILAQNGRSSAIEIDGRLRLDVVAVSISQEVDQLPLLELIVRDAEGLEASEEILIASASITARRVTP